MATSTACSSSPCENGGTCTPNGTEFNCACSPGYSDPLCGTREFGLVVVVVLVFLLTISVSPPSKETNPCFPNPCLNGGTCASESNSTGFTCACAAGFSGSSCSTVCASNPCLNGGTCVANSTATGWTCQCLQDYDGVTCDTREWGPFCFHCKHWISETSSL